MTTEPTKDIAEPVGFITAEMLKRRREFEANGIVMFDHPCGTATMPVYAAATRPALDDADVERVARAIKAVWDAAIIKEAEETEGFDYEPGPWEEWIPEATAAISTLQNKDTSRG